MWRVSMAFFYTNASVVRSLNTAYLGYRTVCNGLRLNKGLGQRIVDNGLLTAEPLQKTNARIVTI